MTPSRLIVSHDGTTDHLTIQLHNGGSPQSATAGPFTDPLKPEDRADLRWYLEDYLKFPVGIYPDQARKVEAEMAEWGGRMFELLFGPGKPAREVYVQAREQGLRHIDFEVHYRAPHIGTIPWELLYDPENDHFLVHEFASFSRYREGAPPTLLEPRPAGEALNVLVVIARPYGGRDVPYRTVARPMMEILQAPHLQRRIHVEILRPPTFEHLKAQLTRRRGDSREPFFDVLHFDGHGGFDLAERVPGEPLRVFDLFDGPHGKLLFETEEGGEHAVEVEELRQWLGQHQVPLVVLNACRSGMETLDEPQMQQLLALQAQLRQEASEELKVQLAEQNRRIASVAGTLLDAGADGVVAMGYVVRARAAAVFMRVFYHRLLEGGTAAEAVTSGRLALREQPNRPTSFGDLPLEDWLIPVYHQRMSLRLFQPPQSSDADLLFEALRQGQEAETEPRDLEPQLPAAPRHGFVGRDLELLEIERALRRTDVAGVAIVGLGGNGKTTLATGAARWLRATHAPQVAAGVYFHAFVDRNEKDQAVHPALPMLIRNAGCQRFGPEFKELGEAEQRKVLTSHLRQDLCLLVLDNVETAAGLGELPALLSEEERQAFRSFLSEICHPHGNTRLLLTSRRAEEWLDLPLAPVGLGGLDPEAAGELAHKVLATALSSTELQERKENTDWCQAYDRLLATLHGHPLALQIVLPHLKNQKPEQVLQAFESGQATLDHQLSTSGTDRERTLASCLDYSFSTLPQPTQHLLEVLGFFRETVDTGVLTMLSTKENGHEVPERLRDLTSEHWQAVLHQAATTGLVEALSHPTGFRLHPLLPWFLTARLRKAPDHGALETTFRRAMAGLAAAILRSYQQGEQPELAIGMFIFHQATFFHALARARKIKEVDTIFPLVDCLYDLLESTDQAPRARQLRAELTSEWQPSGELEPFTPESRFWVKLELLRAAELSTGGDPSGAHQALEALVATLGEEEDSDAAVVYHQLGRAATEIGDLKQARIWYSRCLDISLRFGTEAGAAAAYLQLGIVAEQLGQLEEAQQWCQKSLEICLHLNNCPHTASVYHQLGLVAQKMGQFDQALDWYEASVDIKLRLGSYAAVASSYHQIGSVAQELKQFEQAESLYKASLGITLRLGNVSRAASTYGDLGVLSASIGRGSDATAYLLKAMAIFQRWNDPQSAQRQLHNLRGYVHNDLVTLTTVAELWQAEMGSAMPEDVAKFLTAPPVETNP